MNLRLKACQFFIVALFLGLAIPLSAQNVLSAPDLLGLKSVGSPRLSPDGTELIYSVSTPHDPGNLYHWNGKKEVTKLTNINPDLAEKSLGKQEVIKYTARDGVEIEGLLIHPVCYDKSKNHPLVVYVHGGPESHHSNGWLSRYSTPAQVMAGKGYLVLYLNYRASTGYGVAFGMEGFMNPAGTEFDDIADAIEWAVCMFVGISNNISKRGTTDIAYEELYVHSGKKLEEQWQLALEGPMPRLDISDRYGLDWNYNEYILAI